ncbi:MAG: 50S ribosomal protein L28 [Chloroflexi bacterium]|nr:50S ribosomal protein L28 [Chloroflexota bacterium]
MSKKARVSKAKPQFGNYRSFSMHSTRRQFKPNMQNKRFYVPEYDQWVQLRVSTSELRTIDKIGLVEFLKRNDIPVKAVLKGRYR